MTSVSVRDVASVAGVSVGTVSNVLNHPEKVGSETVSRVQDAIDRLGFVRNDAARQLRAGRSRAIGMVMLDISNPFFTDLARGAEDRAAEAGVSLILGSSDQHSGRESNYLDLFEEQRLLGVLISPIGDVSVRLHGLRARGISAVLVDRAGSDPSFSSVSVDDLAGGQLAAEHLIALGRRRLAFVGGPLSIRQASDRLEGARRAVRTADAAGARVSLEVIEVHEPTVAAGRAAGERIAARPAPERPDAVFAANDLLALGVLQAMFAQGAITVPDEIALIGYDDIAFASAAVVPLSSIRQPSGLIGNTAVGILLDEIENPGAAPRHIVFTPELVVRESTGAPTLER